MLVGHTQKKTPKISFGGFAAEKKSPLASSIFLPRGGFRSQGWVGRLEEEVYKLGGGGLWTYLKLSNGSTSFLWPTMFGGLGRRGCFYWSWSPLADKRFVTYLQCKQIVHLWWSHPHLKHTPGLTFPTHPFHLNLESKSYKLGDFLHLRRLPPPHKHASLKKEFSPKSDSRM